MNLVFQSDQGYKGKVLIKRQLFTCLTSQLQVCRFPPKTVQVLIVPYFVCRVSADALTEEASGGMEVAVVPRLGPPESVVQPQTVRLPHFMCV